MFGKNINQTCTCISMDTNNFGMECKNVHTSKDKYTHPDTCTVYMCSTSKRRLQYYVDIHVHVA